MRNPERRRRRTDDMFAVAEISLSGDPHAGLAARAAQGDESAFAGLYDLLVPIVFGVVARVVRDPSMAEEVTQEVFVELWRTAPRYDESRGSVRTWATTIAHRRAVDRVRSEQAARDRHDRDGRETTTTHDPVSHEVESSIDRTRVRKALEALSASQRSAVELAYFGGHTYREVAVLLGVPEGTVKTRIRDGMIRLRDELGGEQ